MMRTVLASAALVAAAHAGGCGDAIVINKCSYDVYLSNTPAADGGYTEIDKTLSSGDSYSQTYTQLTNNNGWSLKLSKNAGQFWNNILQYEYTYHNDGTIWYDLSEVNGNPWDGNWEITATNGCTPRQAAYRYATDDAYGMQACDSDASITVTLCSGDSGSGSPSPPESSAAPGTSSAAPETSSAAPETSTAPAYTSQAPEPSTSTKEHHHGGHHTWGLDGDAVEAPAGKFAVGKEKVQPTTLATTSVAYNGAAVTVTNVHMQTVTQFVTATAAPAKRHVHHRHAHGRL